MTVQSIQSTVVSSPSAHLSLTSERNRQITLLALSALSSIALFATLPWQAALSMSVLITGCAAAVDRYLTHDSRIIRVAESTVIPQPVVVEAHREPDIIVYPPAPSPVIFVEPPRPTCFVEHVRPYIPAPVVRREFTPPPARVDPEYFIAPRATVRHSDVRPETSFWSGVGSEAFAQNSSIGAGKDYFSAARAPVGRR